MEKEFVPYEQALALKELGFDEPCFVYWVYNGVEITFSTSHNKSGWSMIGFKNNQMDKKAGLCTAPTFSQAFKWFREKYELYSFVFRFDEGFGYETYKEGVTQTNDSFDTYEEAELECLKKLIQITKQKQ
jgi:hypothetical protein